MINDISKTYPFRNTIFTKVQKILIKKSYPQKIGIKMQKI